MKILFNPTSENHWLYRLLNWKKIRAQKKQRIQDKTESVINSYEELIKEYELIQNKKSNLSKSQRDFVVMRINHLISKGHLLGVKDA